MNIHRNSIGVEISPSVLRVASLSRRNGVLHLTATGAVRLPYRDFDDLYEHPKECGDALNDLCVQNNIQLGFAIATLPAARAKSKCVALPLIGRRALSRMLSSRHFWHKHLGVGNDDYSYTQLTTIHDKQRYRLSIYLMAVPNTALAFYKAVFARTRLSLNVLTLSSLVYYGVQHKQPARRLLVVNEYEAYLAHLGVNVFSHRTIVSDHDHKNLCASSDTNVACNEKQTAIALQHLSESLHERLRSEQGDNHTLYLIGNLNRQTATRLESSLNDIVLKPLDIAKNIKPSSQTKDNCATMSAPIALAYWLASDAATFKTQANFIHNHRNEYYKSTVCWIFSTIISAILFFYYQHIVALDATQHAQRLYQTQLSTQQDEYKNKLDALRQRTERRRQMQAQMQFLSTQHHSAMALWAHLGAVIPSSVKIESIDCRWQSSCLITAVAGDYGQLIVFVEQLEQLDMIHEVAIDSSQTIQEHSGAMQFTLSCKLNNGIDE